MAVIFECPGGGGGGRRATKIPSRSLPFVGKAAGDSQPQARDAREREGGEISIIRALPAEKRDEK